MFPFTCHNHWKSADDKLPAWTNVSRRRDYHATPNAAGIAPYARPHNDPACGNPESCIPDCYLCKGQEGADPDAMYCDLPDPALDLITVSGSTRVNQGQFYNEFKLADPADTVSFAQCFKAGFKNLFARKEWHGKGGYCDEDVQLYDQFSYCGACAVKFNRPNHPTTRYLKLSATSHYESKYTGSEGEAETYIADASSWSEIDPHSGVASGATTTSSNQPEGTPSDTHYRGLALGLSNGANGDAYAVWNSYAGMYWQIANLSDGSELYSIVGGGNTWTLTWRAEFWDGSTTVLRDKYILTISGGTSMSLDVWGSVYAAGGGGLVWIQQSHVEMSFSGTHYHYSFWGVGETGGWNGSDSGWCEADLSEPYTEGDVRGEIVSLLSQWDLSDDRLYPYRTDGAATSGPVVVYDEKPRNQPMLPWQATDGDDQYTGEILGKPHSCYGAHYWDDRFANWTTCLDDVSGDTVWYIESYGGAAGAPWSATKWTNRYDSDPTSPAPWTQAGAFMRNDYTTCYAGSWVEIKNRRPAINWARPCGKDRWQVKSEAWCIKSLSSTDVDGTVTFSDITSPPGINTGDLCAVCGVGICTLTKVSDYVFTIATVVATQALLDAEGASPWLDCGTGMAALVRWPGTVPPICKPLAIVNITGASGDPYVCHVAASYLVNGDTVEVSGVTTPGDANDTWTVTVNDDGTEITLVGSSSDGGAYLGDGMMASPGQCDPSWYSTKSQWTAVLHAFQTNFRDVGEYQRLYNLEQAIIAGMSNCDVTANCPDIDVPENPRATQAANGMAQQILSATHTQFTVGVTPCGPPVMAIVPMTDDAGGTVPKFPAGSYVVDYQWAITENTTLDREYGSFCGAYFESEMVDPFYLAPHCPCTHYVQIDPDTGEPINPDDPGAYECHPYTRWLSDDGECLSDVAYDPLVGTLGIRYYPAPPMVEAVNGVPVGAKIPPAGTFARCATQPEANTSWFSGRICNYWGVGAMGFRPWLLWLNEEGCVCGSGRFVTEYRDDGVSCVTAEVEI